MAASTDAGNAADRPSSQPQQNRQQGLQQSQRQSPSRQRAPPAQNGAPFAAELPLRQTLAAQRTSMTEALQELARGERAADRLEAELRVFEAKLEDLLASIGMADADLEGLEKGGGEDEEGSGKKDEGKATPGPADKSDGGEKSQSGG